MKGLLNACAGYAGGDPTDSLRQLTGQFLVRARSYPSDLSLAAEALKTLPPRGAAWLAVAIGAAVEDGGDAGLATPAVVDLFLSWLPRLPVSQRTDAVPAPAPPAPTPEQASLLEAFRELAPAVVSHVARSPATRERLSHDIALLDRLEVLEDYTAGAAWIRETLLRSSGTLIVLYPPGEMGFRLRYENVATCFHLFSLIQAAIGERIPGGRKADPAVVASAKGKSRDAVTDEAWWHYGDPRSKTADPRRSIWGEALVREIPIVNAERVVVLWPLMVASRSWNSAFFGPQLDALAPDVVIQEALTVEECRAWLEALGIGKGGRRRRWWLW